MRNSRKRATPIRGIIGQVNAGKERVGPLRNGNQTARGVGSCCQTERQGKYRDLHPPKFVPPETRGMPQKKWESTMAVTLVSLL